MAGRAPYSLSTFPQSALLQAIVDAAMDAIVVIDAEQNVVLFNPAAEAMFGVTAGEALGEPLDRFIPAPLRAIHRRHVATFGQTGETTRSMGYLGSLTAVHADGAEFPIEATIARVAIEGQPYYAAIIRDISARQQAEAALRHQAKLLDLAYDAIFTRARDGAITYWSRGAERLYGYTADEAVGQRADDLLRTRHPDGLDTVLASLERDGVWEGELTHTVRDGNEIVVRSRHVLIDDLEGHLVLEVNQDITAYKRAEAERIATEERAAAAQAVAAASEVARERLLEILESFPGGVLLMTAPDAGIEFINRTMREMLELVGASQTLPVYGHDFCFLRADGTPLPRDERPGMRVLRGELVQNLHLVLQRGDGSHLPVVVSAAKLRNDQQEKVTAIVFFQDATAIRQAEQLKDDFLAFVSHELRTPLSAIYGDARVLVNKPHLDEATRAELLQDVVVESERLNRLLGNLLTLVNVKAGRLPVSLEPVMLPPLLTKTAADTAGRSRAHTVSFEFTPGLPPVEADPILLEEVLRNLYENAVKYSPQGGTIRTSAVEDHETVAICITDEGIGIEPEQVAAAFERFRRVGTHTTTRGMGLGLYLCRELMEIQGGQITGYSPGRGQGATFTLTLPIARGWADTEEDE